MTHADSIAQGSRTHPLIPRPQVHPRECPHGRRDTQEDAGHRRLVFGHRRPGFLVSPLRRLTPRAYRLDRPALLLPILHSCTPLLLYTQASGAGSRRTPPEIDLHRRRPASSFSSSSSPSPRAAHAGVRHVGRLGSTSSRKRIASGSLQRGIVGGVARGESGSRCAARLPCPVA